MIKILAVVVLLAVAQIIPSCGDEGASGRPQVLGWVDEKTTRNQTAETNPYILVINNIEYGVPYDFWRTVNKGDLVKFDGDKWTIVRKGRS